MVNYPFGGEVEYRDLSEVIVLVLHPSLSPHYCYLCYMDWLSPQKTW